MITKVEVRTDRGELLTLSLLDLSEGYLVQNIEGLDPVKAILVSSSFANMDGQQFQSSRRESRFIVLNLGFEPDYVTSTVKTLRDKLYKFFMPKSRVQLRLFEDDGVTANISGRIEDLVSPRFVQEPDAKIYITCFDPDFVSIVDSTFTGETVEDTTEETIEYDGTVETGFLFTLNVDRIVDAFTIYLKSVDDSIKTLEFGGDLEDGDVLKISTVSGNKYATLTRDGMDSSFLYGVSPFSSWLNLFPGDNDIRVVSEGDPIPFTIDYTEKYGGF